VEGELTLVTNSGEELLRAGDCAAFPRGVEDGHHLINKSARRPACSRLAIRTRKIAVSIPTSTWWWGQAVSLTDIATGRLILRKRADQESDATRQRISPRCCQSPISQAAEIFPRSEKIKPGRTAGLDEQQCECGSKRRRDWIGGVPAARLSCLEAA
jgi:hypothetical protein